jgi:hypothetical protein
LFRTLLVSSANSHSTNFAFNHHPIIDATYSYVCVYVCMYVVTDRSIKYPTKKKMNAPYPPCALCAVKGIGTFYFHVVVVVLWWLVALKNDVRSYSTHQKLIRLLRALEGNSYECLWCTQKVSCNIVELF